MTTRASGWMLLAVLVLWSTPVRSAGTEELVEAMLADYRSADCDRYLSHYSPAIVFEDVAQRQRLEGSEAFAALCRQILGIHRAIGIDVRRRFVAPESAALEVEWHGTVDGAVLGSPGKDLDYRYSGVVLLALEDGLIRGETHYIDLPTFREQFDVSGTGGGEGPVDVRPQSLREGEPSAEAVRRGRELLELLARRHGLEAWRQHETSEAVAVDEWAPALVEAGMGWWATPRQRLRLTALLGTFTSRADLLDGPQAGRVLTLQSWAGWTREPGSEEDVPTEEQVVRFYLPTLQYFAELPFRLTRAPLVASAGPAELEGRRYELVYVTWDRFEPHAEHDQYVLWIDAESGLLAMCRYTVREAGPALAGTIHFEDYRPVEGVEFPFRQTVTLPPPEETVRPLEENFFHRMLFEDVRFDGVGRAALILDPSLPPADAKPGG